jgi:hypothetical protein
VILFNESSHGHADYKPLVRQILLLLHPASAGGYGPQADRRTLTFLQLA